MPKQQVDWTEKCPKCNGLIRGYTKDGKEISYKHKCKPTDKPKTNRAVLRDAIKAAMDLVEPMEKEYKAEKHLWPADIQCHLQSALDLLNEIPQKSEWFRKIA